MSALLSLDSALSHAISSLAGWMPLDVLMASASMLGLRGAVWVLLGAWLIVRRGAPAAEGFVRLGWALVLALLLTDAILKPLVARPRPDVASEVRPAVIELATSRTDGYSFPSGHAMSAAAGAYALALMWPRRRRCDLGARRAHRRLARVSRRPLPGGRNRRICAGNRGCALCDRPKPMLYFRVCQRFSRRAEVAQLVEHTTENRSVGSSILPLGTIYPPIPQRPAPTIRPLCGR